MREDTSKFEKCKRFKKSPYALAFVGFIGENVRLKFFSSLFYNIERCIIKFRPPNIKFDLMAFVYAVEITISWYSMDVELSDFGMGLT